MPKQIDHFFSMPILLKLALITLTFSLLVAIIIGSCFYAKLSTEQAVQASAIVTSGDFSQTNREILSSLGTYGDFMGGTLNPLISFMGLVASLIALFYIKKTYDKQNEEVEILKREQSQTLITESLLLAEKTLENFLPHWMSQYTTEGDNRETFKSQFDDLIENPINTLTRSENITIEILNVFHILNLIGETNRHGDFNSVRNQPHATILLHRLFAKAYTNNILIIIIITEKHRDDDFFRTAYQNIAATKLLQRISTERIKDLLKAPEDPTSSISTTIAQNKNHLASKFLESAKNYNEDAFGTNTDLLKLVREHPNA